MLVLKRKIGESISIGPDVIVTVLRVRGGQVTIGIHAPQEMEIHRSSKPEAEKKEAPHDTDH